MKCSGNHDCGCGCKKPRPRPPRKVPKKRPKAK